VASGVELGSAPRTPVAAYRYDWPYTLLTLLPLMALIRYQLEPDFAPGQVVLQCDPLTVATTVTFALVARRVLIDDDVDAAARTFTPEQAGIIVVEPAAAVWDTETRRPPNSPSTADRSQTRVVWRWRTRVRGGVWGVAMRGTMAAAMRARNGSMGPYPSGAMGP
jgi:hypothetical protein